MNLKRIQNFVDGRWEAPSTGAYLLNFNPAIGEAFSEIPNSSAQDVDLAVESAARAFVQWSRKSKSDRAPYLNRIADRIEARADEFAELESQDQGKPVTLARKMDIDRSIRNFRFFADQILQESETTPTEIYHDTGFHSYVERKPVGVAGLISPWNLPLYLLSWKIAPALACGNTVVCKPSELTSMTAALLAEVCLEIGLPSGVLNIVFGLGDSVGAALVRHPHVQLISFTGGTETGRKIYRESAEHFKKISLELGGKNPNLIFADCDLEKAVATTIRSSFLNQGEICLCGSRIYVEQSLLPEFLKVFIPAVQNLKVGDPKAADTFMGALVSEDHLRKVQSYIRLAKEEGGQILCGGDQPQLSGALKKGYFLNPTVILGLSENSRCVQEEIFGPVVTIASFRSVDEAIEKANGVRYGLSATVWTKDAKKAESIASRLHSGTVWINDWMLRDLRVPFGGMKHSGLGREGGKYSTEFYTEATTVVVKET